MYNVIQKPSPSSGVDSSGLFILHPSTCDCAFNPAQCLVEACLSQQNIPITWSPFSTGTARAAPGRMFPRASAAVMRIAGGLSFNSLMNIRTRPFARKPIFAQVPPEPGLLADTGSLLTTARSWPMAGVPDMPKGRSGLSSQY